MNALLMHKKCVSICSTLLLGLALGVPAPTPASNPELLYPESLDPNLDVLHYDLRLDIDPGKNVLQGNATLELKTVRNTPAIQLDLLGLQVSEVLVNGQQATFQHTGQHLHIDLGQSSSVGRIYEVQVAYSGTPQTIKEPGETEADSVGWKQHKTGIYVLNEPNGAMSWFPANDHPSDKATFTFHLTVPLPDLGVANGVLVSTAGDRVKTYTYEMRQPMAPHLATVQVNRFRMEWQQFRENLVYQNYFPVSLPAKFQQKELGMFEPMLSFLEQQVAPYPFETYGVMFTEAPTPYALETQGLSTFPGKTREAALFFHELAHQWFGNSVTPSTWSDVWLSEGLATFFTNLWEHPEEKDLKVYLKSQYQRSKTQNIKAPYIRERKDLFSPRVYQRGALVFHALRYRVGNKLFQQVVQNYYRAHAFKNASTEDFIQSVLKTTGKPQLRGFLESWIYGDRLPDFPELSR
ncbi:M1 family metallopeptidase [Deinococcus roseus]|uniref:Aminopeptidase N n=1 Tax=Deinococcus roseus TaxID=392414 RepID=A0ABQ2CVV5_9DEIO|nr:M1 family metallopeptidase [Deinococcus roseus]GGJ25680.1 zinc metalloprotease [Deinococcus roseus]